MLRKAKIRCVGAMAIERVLFVAGLHRSGTSLIEQTIYARYETVALRANVPENEGQHLQDVYPPALAHGGPGRFAFSAQMRPPAPDAQTASNLRDAILACWTPHFSGEGDVLIEKSPPNLTKIRWLRRVFPGSSFLIVVRDPRVVAAATQKWRADSLDQLIDHWEAAYAIAMEDYASDCAILRYEDFCADPAGALRACGLDTALRRRKRFLSPDPRFERIAGSNDAYAAQIATISSRRGLWEKFGYRF